MAVPQSAARNPLSAPHGQLWLTEKKVLVRQRGTPEFVDGAWKIHAYRVPSGGYHGLLRLEHLTIVTN